MFRRAKGPDLLRSLVVASILADPLSELADPTVRDRLISGEGDVTFDELGLDSLARLTLAARLDADHGYPVSESDVARGGSVAGLVALLRTLPPPAATDADGEPAA
jgi:hypothetical protein